MRKLPLIQIFIASSVICIAQIKTPDCKSNLLNYCQSMSKIREPQAGTVYHMNYSVETIYKTEKSQTGSKFVSADILVGSKKSFYETSIMSAYADEKNGFLVLPLQKKIIWGPGGKSLNSEKNFNALAAFQDSMIRYSRVISCRMVKDNKEDQQEIILEPPQEIKTKLNVKKTIVLYSIEKKIVRKVIIEYAPEHDIAQMIVTYLDMDFNSKVNLSETAYEKIFNKNGKPRPEYRSYEIVDNRKIN